MLLSTSTAAGTAPLTAYQRSAAMEVGFNYAKRLHKSPLWGYWSREDRFRGAIVESSRSGLESTIEAA